MRKILISCVIIFLILSVTPLCALVTNPNRIPAFAGNAQSNQSSIDEEKAKVIKIAANICDDDFCDEGLKCALAIGNNNKNFAQTNNAKEKIEISDEFYERLSNLYNKSIATLEYKGEAVYIPTSSMSSGFIKESPDYPYIKSVASPWDCSDKNFVYKKDYTCGISMAGLNYLCENGMSFKEALKWYLPEFTIQ